MFKLGGLPQRGLGLPSGLSPKDQRIPECPLGGVQFLRGTPPPGEAVAPVVPQVCSSYTAGPQTTAVNSRSVLCNLSPKLQGRHRTPRGTRTCWAASQGEGVLPATEATVCLVWGWGAQDM